MSELKPKPITLKGAGPSALDDLPLTAPTDVVLRDRAIVAHAERPELKLAVKALMRTGRSPNPHTTEPELPPIVATLPDAGGALDAPAVQAIPDDATASDATASDATPADPASKPADTQSVEPAVSKPAAVRVGSSTRAMWALMLTAGAGLVALCGYVVMRLIQPASVTEGATPAPAAAGAASQPGGTSTPPAQTTKPDVNPTETETTKNSPPVHSSSEPVRTAGPGPSADTTARASTALPTVLPTGPSSGTTTPKPSSTPGIYIMKPQKEQP